MAGTPRPNLRLTDDRQMTDLAVGIARLRRVGSEAGLTELGACAVRPFIQTRTQLERRRAAGLNDDMAFTYRNPARSTDPARIVKGARTIVVGALSYSSTPPTAPEDRPSARVARYAIRDHYAELRAGLQTVASELKSLGHRAVVVADENSMVDREVAWRAGLGFYGKNANLMLSGGRGSWFILGSVVTTAEVGPVGRPVSQGCGSCRRCVDACPTGAIVAPGVVDARRCIAWALQSPQPLSDEMRLAIGDRIYGCDDCQEVCPPSRRWEAGTGAAEAPGHRIDPVSWLSLGDDALMAVVDRWYVPGRDPSVVRRNLLVVIANSGHSGSMIDQVIAVHVDHAHPEVAATAVWARMRLARQDDRS